MNTSKLEAKHMARRKDILQKLHSLRAIHITDPQVLGQIVQRVGYRLPE